MKLIVIIAIAMGCGSAAWGQTKPATQPTSQPSLITSEFDRFEKYTTVSTIDVELREGSAYASWMVFYDGETQQAPASRVHLVVVDTGGFGERNPELVMLIDGEPVKLQPAASSSIRRGSSASYAFDVPTFNRAIAAKSLEIRVGLLEAKLPAKLSEAARELQQRVKMDLKGG